MSEPPGVRASVQEAVGALAAAYRGCTGAGYALRLPWSTSICLQNKSRMASTQGRAATRCGGSCLAGTAEWGRKRHIRFTSGVDSFPPSLNIPNYKSQNPAGTAVTEIEALLLESIAAPEEGRRLAAVRWALRLFPFRHVAARYVCCVAAGDRKLEVREAGLGGLKPPKAPGGAASGASTGLARLLPQSEVS